LRQPLLLRADGRGADGRRWRHRQDPRPRRDRPRALRLLRGVSQDL